MADFTWADGGVQMTPERIAALRKVADAQMAAGGDYSPILSPWQGVARVMQGVTGGIDAALADRAERKNMKSDKDMIASLISGGGAAPAASPAAAPSVSSQPDIVPSSAPRGIRNNNPGNIEDGPFAQRMPGYAGTDGRFAKFAAPENGMTAMDSLLASYGARGINNVSGVVNRWAPPSDNNPTSTYAATVAKGMGIDPSAQIDLNDPAIRQKLAAGMTQFENGRPVQVAQAGNTVPIGTTEAPPGPSPGMQAVASAMQPQAAPQATPQARGPMSGIDPRALAVVASPYASEGTKKIAALILQHQMGDKVSYQTTPDGSIIALDPMGRAAPKVMYQAPTKPTFGVIGETPDGGKQYGWTDPGAKAGGRGTGVEAYNPAGSQTPTPITGADGKPIAVPPGVDPKEFRKRVTETVADAAAGKKTEVQAKDERFANKMELAEKIVTDVGSDQGAGFLNRVLDAKIPFTNTGAVPGSNYLQSEKFQKYRQARDNFITALLRDESGAAIGSSEFDRYEKEMFPQPGDGPGVITQKAEARRIAIEGMKKGAGPGYKPPTAAPGSAEAPTGVDGKVWAAMTPQERALWK